MQEHTFFEGGLTLCLKGSLVRECIVEGLERTVDKTEVEGHFVLPPTCNNEALTMYQELINNEHILLAAQQSST